MRASGRRLRFEDQPGCRRHRDRGGEEAAGAERRVADRAGSSEACRLPGADSSSPGPLIANPITPRDAAATKSIATKTAPPATTREVSSPVPPSAASRRDRSFARKTRKQSPARTKRYMETTVVRLVPAVGPPGDHLLVADAVGNVQHRRSHEEEEGKASPASAPSLPPAVLAVCRCVCVDRCCRGQRPSSLSGAGSRVAPHATSGVRSRSS